MFPYRLWALSKQLVILALFLMESIRRSLELQVYQTVRVETPPVVASVDAEGSILLAMRLIIIIIINQLEMKSKVISTK